MGSSWATTDEVNRAAATMAADVHPRPFILIKKLKWNIGMYCKKQPGSGVTMLGC